MMQYYKILFLLLFTFVSGTVLSQNNIKGKIKDKAGNPIEDARIVVKGLSGISTFSDKEGAFELVDLQDAVLVITTPEGKSKTIKYEGGDLDITIDKYSNAIPIGFGRSQRNEELTSAIGTATAAQLESSSAHNPAEALYGKIPGLMVMENGNDAGSRNPGLLIRGISTYNDASILVLVDGFERPFSSLSLSEIESVSILKDGAALAAYGMQGANGVLLVTTKRGAYKKMEVNVSYDYGINKAFRLPEFLDSYQYAQAVNEALVYDGQTSRYSQAELDAYKNGNLPLLYPNTNWMDETLKEYGTTSNFNTTFRGGGQSFQYFVSLNYLGEEGLFDPLQNTKDFDTKQDYDRVNFRTNLDVDVTKTTKLLLNIGGSISDINAPSVSTSNVFNAIYSVPSAAFPVKTGNGIWGGNETYSNNPVALISERGYSKNHERTLFSDIRLQQDLDFLLSGLSGELAVSYDNSALYTEGISQQYQYQKINAILDANDGTVLDSDTTTYGENITNSPSNSLADQWRHGNVEIKLNYLTSWGNNSLNMMLMYRQDKEIFIKQNNTYLHQDIVGTAHYNNSGKYIADVTLAYSGSNILPEGNRFGIYPALAGAWILSNEDFLSQASFIDFLKIRASVGLSGNDLIQKNISEQSYYSGNGYYFKDNNTSASGFYEGRIETPDLKPETSTKYNVGIDATLAGKLDITIDAFIDQRNNILVNTSDITAGALGVNAPYQNIGSVVNKGIETGLTWKNSVGDLDYFFNGQFSFVRNERTEMAEIARPFDHLERTGTPVGQFFGLEAIGFFKDEEDIASSPEQSFSQLKPGDIKYKDQNGDDLIDENDEIALGKSWRNPEMYFSSTLGISYKGIGFEILFQGSANQSVSLNTPGLFWPLRDNTSITKFSSQRWTPETHETAVLPRLTLEENANNYQTNSIWIADASFLKLRNVEIFYNIPEKMLKHIKINKMKIYVRGSNLLSIDNIDIVDPEDVGIGYPTLTSYNFGVKIGF